MWLLNAFTWVALIFLAVELHGYLERRRAIPKEERRTLRQVTRFLLPQLPQEKAEFLRPMDDEEYQEHLDEESGRSALVQTLIDKLPWNQQPPKSPSSDS
jgi:hypothetical protein